MPRCCNSSPRKKLPPPMTTATCTPECTTSAICLATVCTTSGSTPTPPPPNISPPSLSSTRWYLAGRGPRLRSTALSETAGSETAESATAESDTALSETAAFSETAALSGCAARPSYVSSARSPPDPNVRSLTDPPGCSDSRPTAMRSHTSLRLADLEASEASYGHTGSVQYRLDGLLAVLHRGLLQQHDVFEEPVDPALDDLRQGLLGLALLACGLLGDTPLVGDNVLGDLSAGDEPWPHGGDLHGGAAGGLGIGTLVLDEHADSGWQIGGTPMQVGDDRAVEVHNPAQLKLLPDPGRQLGDRVANGPAIEHCGPELIDLSGAGLFGRFDDAQGKLLELLVLGHEVGLAVQLDHDAAVRGHQAVGRRTLRALANVLGALDSQQLNGLVEVSIGFAQGLLTIHHSGPGVLPEPLDVGGGEVRHRDGFRPLRVWSGGHDTLPVRAGVAPTVSIVRFVCFGVSSGFWAS